MYYRLASLLVTYTKQAYKHFYLSKTSEKGMEIYNDEKIGKGK